MMLQKKSHGHLIHISDFINEEDGQLVIQDEHGNVVKDAWVIIYPGAKGDAWWDMEQLLKQMDKAITIFDEAHPDCQALFVFDQLSAHASLGPDALHAFDMNKTNGGKQQRQRDTIIPQTNPTEALCGKFQSMMMDSGEPKGLELTLKEQGFNVKGMQAKCKPVCPVTNEHCCMAWLLSHQDDFADQISMLENMITKQGHLCIFLPKFHCELNLIEMVHVQFAYSRSCVNHKLTVGYITVLGLGKISL